MDEGLLLLFTHAFLAATILPFASEVTLGAMAMQGVHGPWILWGWATAGNLLGALVNYGAGWGLARFRHHPLFPVSDEAFQRAQERFLRYGAWSLLLAWVPVVGDPLTVVAGWLRTPMLLFIVLVGVGKGARYAALLWGLG